MNVKPPVVVAEIGCNHKGDMDIAREMIGIAATFARCEYVKFQKRTNRELLTPEEYAAPHPNPMHAYGPSYGEHREFLELDLDQHRQLQTWCREFGTGYACSVWDMTSTREIASIEPDYIKVPSACNLRFDILRELAGNYGGDIHISLGMTTPEEEEQIIDVLAAEGALERTVLYACTSGYPVPFDQLCLLEVSELIERYGDTVRAIGFSGHHLGIAADIAAYTLGANWVERHFTLDRTWKGTDHAASLEPDGLRRLVRDLRAVSQALTRRDRPILDIEVPQRKKLKRFEERV
ncbi:N-acetylneuraminate synthase family protein [Elongatibacter sediminis]|uniref:N-acetylneuraminate synthase family protein n=1 Tax=Elongatibacter sediminis TaxID=3119006 RepID=A0AAW9R748_9GAMM